MSENQPDSRNGINRHFKRESRIMLWFTIGVPIVLTIVIWLLAPFILPALGR
jgi:hypothetical protein